MLSVIKNIFCRHALDQKKIDTLLDEVKKNNNVELYEELAEIYSKNNDVNRAVEYIKKACDLYIENNHRKKTIELQEKLVNLEPDNIEHLISLADLYELYGDIYKAIENYNSILKIDSENPDVYFKLANTYASLQKFDDAIHCYEEALKILPESSGLYCALAIVLKDTNKIEKSIDFFKHAIELNPALPEAYHNLGLAYFEIGNFKKSLNYLEKTSNIYFGEPWNLNMDNILGQISKSATVSNNYPPIFKCKHDLEQFKYLLKHNKIPESFSTVIGSYDALIKQISNAQTLGKEIEIPDVIVQTYNKPVYVDRKKCGAPTINSELDFERITKKYFDAEPNAIYFDDFLTTETLRSLRNFCMENCFWHTVKSEYLGATMPGGFFSDTLLNIAVQLRSNFPDIFKDHQLQTMWAFKYDSQLSGINLHADDAAINVNFWISDDDANIDKNTGGLVFYDKKAPKEWGFNMYNMDVESIQEYLESVNSNSISVPYRENRAVLFDSDLFHRTDSFNFKDGYENRRINITMLFGLRNI